MRYKQESKKKRNGAVYTPREFADFLAQRLIKACPVEEREKNKVISILDPAAGNGELLRAMAEAVYATYGEVTLEVAGYEMDAEAAAEARRMLHSSFPSALINISTEDFFTGSSQSNRQYDFIIANPPYVRAQVLDHANAVNLAKAADFSGKLDMYYLFLMYAKRLLSPQGVAGYIVSNKFLTIKSGSTVRDFMVENYSICELIDFGDTKLFSAAVLPCVVVFTLGKTTKEKDIPFISVYEEKETCDEDLEIQPGSLFAKIDKDSKYRAFDGRLFSIRHGKFSNANSGKLWLLSSSGRKEWLKRVEQNTWLQFSDIGKIRVGIKSTADNVFIGNNWAADGSEPELLRPLITHRDAGQIVPAKNSRWQVLYPHASHNGKRVALDIQHYPRTKAYLERHYEQLAGRSYVQKANRNWYEIWVPQNPDSWRSRKIVFRDIAEQPQFWLDETGAVVNGDCYWIDIENWVNEDLLYLALAVANSKFIEQFYDARFNTKLYSGKRRYMSQYVEQFPIPFMNEAAHHAIQMVKNIVTGGAAASKKNNLQELNSLVEEMFLQ